MLLGGRSLVLNIVLLGVKNFCFERGDGKLDERVRCFSDCWGFLNLGGWE